MKYKAPNSISWTSIEVLGFLKGRKCDQVVMNYIHSLRPSKVRFVKGSTKLDHHVWRVTVHLDENNFVQEIKQEIEVGVDGFEDAYDMESRRYTSMDV